VTLSAPIVRIGGASAFWGDSAVGPIQLAWVDGLNYMVFDYLAELTMSILSAARARQPELGFATDFVDVAMRHTLKTCRERGIRIVANAGGINPRACARALEKLASELGCEVRVAVVDGDDVLSQMPSLRARGVADFYRGTPMPEKLVSANAYLGARPIARALDHGADIVVTGRVVDSALVLGILMHEFDWLADDWDRLAAGSLAGHIIECGCQATGGLHTDWESVPDWAHIGYPVIECRQDGSFVVTKPEGSGGRVYVPAVAEQMLYEIGDPANYVLPDVVCDFTRVTMTGAGHERVEVKGARGRAPTDSYKVSATYVDGFRCVGTLTIVGFDATAKARRSGEAIIERTRDLFKRFGLGDYSAVRVDVLGSEADYGPHARAHDLREALMRVAVRHARKDALEMFAREIAPAGTSWAPGTTGNLNAGRPSVSPLVRLFSCLIPKAEVAAHLSMAGVDETVACVSASAEPVAAIANTSFDVELAKSADELEVPLIRIAWGRSGDKGDISNVGLIARAPELVPILRREVTVERVAAWLSHLVNGPIIRYDVIGIGAINLVMHDALDGGGTASLRNDPLGKGMAQIVLAMPVHVPKALLGDM